MSKHFRVFPQYATPDDETIKKIWSFVSLESGWCYGRGISASFYVAILATNVVSLLRCNRMESADAFPSEDGSILVTGYADNYTIEVYCETNGNLKLVIEDDNDELECLDVTTLEDAFVEIRRWSGMWDGSRGCFTPSTLTKQSVDIEVRHFSLPAVEGEPQLLTFRV